MYLFINIIYVVTVCEFIAYFFKLTIFHLLFKPINLITNNINNIKEEVLVSGDSGSSGMLSDSLIYY